MASSAIAICSLLAAAAVAPPPAPDAARRAIVSLRVTGQDYNQRAPWSKQRPWSRLANGLVVDGRRILVTGNNVANHTLIEVQKLGEEERFSARVLRVDYEVPLALVVVDDPAFWKDLAPLPLAETAPREGDVTVLRWLDSGQLETARGVVRQVRGGSHWVARTEVLTLDISSPIPSGGYSEVVVAGGQVVGLTTSKLGDQLNALAAPVLRQFMAEPYLGFARHGISTQKILNPALREHLGLSATDGGMLVNRVRPHGSAAGVLQPGDVVLAIGGARIDASGKYEHPRHGKLSFGVLFTDGRKPGDVIDVRIKRAGQERALPMTLRRMLPEDDRVPPYRLDAPPEFLVTGGLVFQHLTGAYLATFERGGPLRLAIANELEGTFPDPARRRIVVLTQVLPDAANLGYEDLSNLIVTRVNGAPIGTLDDLRAAFEKPRGVFHVIELLRGGGVTRLVLDAAEVQTAERRVAALYGLE